METQQQDAAPSVPDDHDEPAGPTVREPRAARSEPRWLSQLRRPVVSLPLALVLAVGVWFVAFRDTSSSTAATATQQLVAVTKGPIGNTVSAEGTIAAAQTANLTFPSSGTVTAVNVKAGDPVTAGEVLASIDSAQLTSSVTGAQATVASAQAKLSDDEAAGASSDQVAADQASLASAGDTLANAQQALAGASLVAAFDGTVSQVNVTPGEQLSSGGTGGVATTGTGTGSGQSSATTSSGGGNGFGSGNSGSGSASSAAAASSSSPSVEVVSKGRYTVTLDVGSSDIGNVAVGQNATVAVTTSSANSGRFGGGFGGGGFGGGGRAGGTGGAGGTSSTGTGGDTTTGLGASATGSVTSVSKVATTTSGVAGYPVVIAFNADANAFYSGATVTGAISTNAKSDVIQVPTRALSTQNAKTVVTVATSGKLGGPTEIRTVTTGLTAGGQTEITSGLKVGEQVVLTLPTAFGGGVGRTGTGGGFGGFPGGTGTRTTTGAGG